MASYVRTTWVAGAAPAMNATRLNNAELGILDANAELNTIKTRKAVVMAISGTLTTGTGKLQFDLDAFEAMTVVELIARVKTAPTGAAISLTATDDGSAIGTVSISAGTLRGNTTTIGGPSVIKASLLQLTVNTVGSTIAGSDLMLYVVYETRPVYAVFP